ncbi:hypothetical protein AAV35_013870 (plasmid) [Salimicrobium jeotgali]|uniref:Uncharacterized protein n=1 Tax=Salimicrobium jeotgali TaxID=1230341 RepID=K2FIC7_9BACI|nr:hypothetical protein [Salimicrobium jeotgali]AKG05822.1 hypothetical protein AAV35_013870 [Salimicrobium jeotgali]EKE30846.1 hypothetical protein MJ3_11390 [Salimicrobium jeotgali]MBM7697444.1 hypothetical protein [Salimicrobium jeotgali]
MAKKYIHTINIIIGVLAVGFSLFLTWAVSAFAPEENAGVIFIPILVTAVWFIGYMLQIKYNTLKNVLITLPVEAIVIYLIITQISSIIS